MFWSLLDLERGELHAEDSAAAGTAEDWVEGSEVGEES